MKDFNEDPKYNENFFKKQIEEMKAKKNKILTGDSEQEKRYRRH